MAGVKRIYFGSVTCEVAAPGCHQVINIACNTFATSEAEAKGWAATKALEKYPTGKLSLVQMFPVPDDWIADAAALLSVPAPVVVEGK